MVKRYLVYKVKTVKPPKKSEEKEKKEVRLRARKRDGTGLLGCGFVSRVRNLWIELARIAIRIVDRRSESSAIREILGLLERESISIRKIF